MKHILTIILVLLLISCASSKKSQEPVVMTQSHTEYNSKNSIDTLFIRDSIDIHDSIYIKEKGDTVFYYKTKTAYKYKIQYKYTDKTDTVCVTDSIPYPVKIIEYKTTNKLTGFQKFLVCIGILSLAAVLAFLIFKINKLYTRK